MPVPKVSVLERVDCSVNVHVISGWNMIVLVSVVLNRTVVVDSD